MNNEHKSVFSALNAIINKLSSYDVKFTNMFFKDNTAVFTHDAFKDLTLSFDWNAHGGGILSDEEVTEIFNRYSDITDNYRMFIENMPKILHGLPEVGYNFFEIDTDIQDIKSGKDTYIYAKIIITDYSYNFID